MKDDFEPYVYSLCSPDLTASPMLSLDTFFEYPPHFLFHKRRPDDVGNHVSQFTDLSAHLSLFSGGRQRKCERAVGCMERRRVPLGPPRSAPGRQGYSHLEFTYARVSGEKKWAHMG
ncbi:hypothetical protein FIBSPDRAFT_873035 [Athelia psychrophila]|uniref:Uncharacterized protein n=1 Tax=Athelia psychrophila TaxID=1759441 RepID=A0A165YWQ7_9AGAM|nr:hypothetical protein FIBSPDRAFT_873035 [Fibularhizoctonia sp. CBS 109695]